MPGWQESHRRDEGHHSILIAAVVVGLRYPDAYSGGSSLAGMSGREVPEQSRPSPSIGPERRSSGSTAQCRHVAEDTERATPHLAQRRSETRQACRDTAVESSLHGNGPAVRRTDGPHFQAMRNTKSALRSRTPALTHPHPGVGPLNRPPVRRQCLDRIGVFRRGAHTPAGGAAAVVAMMPGTRMACELRVLYSILILLPRPAPRGWLAATNIDLPVNTRIAATDRHYRARSGTVLVASAAHGGRPEMTTPWGLAVTMWPRLGILSRIASAVRVGKFRPLRPGQKWGGLS